MEARIVSGNEALALGALRAGVRVVTGYPGTPSSDAIGSLLEMDVGAGRHVEWSVNEKVAFEIAAGAAWAGQRALCTMKMSGLNVAYDSLISIAYSGCRGGLVIYVADDPGVSAGMAEQDSRGFAIMADLPMLDPPSVAEAYRLVQVAFDLSERVGTPVFVRLVTSIANSHTPVAIEEPVAPAEREPILTRDIARFTKAGAAICMAQHRDLIARLEQAGQVIREMGLNQLHLSPGGRFLASPGMTSASPGMTDLSRHSERNWTYSSTESSPGMTSSERSGRGLGRSRRLGIVASGVAASYLEEGLEVAAHFGLDPDAVSVLRITAPHPFPAPQVQALLRHCHSERSEESLPAILVLEELEPYIERGIYVEAQRLGFRGHIVGKLDGTLSRIGEYGVSQVVQGIAQALELPIPEELFRGYSTGEQLAAQRPITMCAGCPHRGTFLAINQAIRRLKLKKDQVMVTGDIGCTILGMNPPFDTVWNEVAMGASVSLAQGYVHAGVRTPVIATIGDSTFFHAGLPGLVNAVQHQVNLTLIIMDNGWTAMTGMQVNPGTDEGFQQPGGRRVDIARLVPALGVEHFSVIDPFDLEASTLAIQQALALPGVKVLLSRRECAIQAQRRGLRAGRVRVLPENCNLCKLCITRTGCPAIGLGESTILIDPALCYGCGLCAQVCQREAIEYEQMTNDKSQTQIGKSANQQISKSANGK